MAEISKITALDGTTYDIKDALARQVIPYGQVDSTSTATAFTATVPGITELRDGTCMLLRNATVTSASGFTININGLGAKPCYSNMATGNPVTPTGPSRETTIFNINYTMLFIYSEDIVSGGGWICYRGYDANTNTIGYQLRTNSSSKKMSDVTYRYRIFFESADGTLWVPANTSSSTNATASRTVNQRAINPFGDIVYYGSTTSVSAGSTPGASSLWQEYTLTLGYSFNRTGAALVLPYPKPIYIKCAPQTNGSAIIDASTPYVTALPTSNDGKIYIYLGRTYSATSIEMVMCHPVYYHDGTGIRIWTGKTIPTKVSELSNDLNFVDAAGASAAAPVKSVNGQTGAVSIAIPSKGSDVGLGNVDNIKQYSASNPPPYPVTSVNGSTGAVTIAIPSKASDVGALPSNITYVSTVNGTSGAVTIHGLPSGGTNGQSLVKTGSTDYAVAWATVSGGGGIAENGLPAGGTAGQFLKKTGTTNYDATWATVTIPSTAADVGALPSSTTYVSSVNGSSGAVTLSIPSVSVSQSLTSGTKIGQITINGATTSLYAPTDTDTKVTQTATASSTYTYWRPLVIGDSSTSTETGAFATSTNEVRVFDILRVQPSTGTIKALNFKGNLTGDVTGTASGNLTSNSTLNPAKLSGVAANTTNFLRSDGTWQKPTIGDITGKQHGIMEMLNPFDPGLGKIYIDRLENAFYFLDKRYSVTGYTEDGEGNQTALTTTKIAQMFDMSEVDSNWPAAGQKAVITMDFTGASGTGTFPNYPYGYLCVNFYNNEGPESVSVRVYGKHTGTTPYWANLTVTDASNGTNQLRYIANQGVMYNMMKLEVTIQAKSDKNASMSEISYYLVRSSYQKDMPYFSKLKAEKLYFSPTAPDYLLTNGTSVATALNSIPSTYVSTVNGSSGAVTIDGILPSGGSTNQVLKKTSNTDYVVAWDSVPSEVYYGSSEPSNSNITIWVDPSGSASGGMIPSGGTVGQVLAKASNDDFSTQWTSLNQNDFKIYNSVTDLGYTAGASGTTIANVYNSMPNSSILIVDAGEFPSSEVPSIYGTVKITKVYASRPDIEFIGKYTSTGFYKKGMSSGETISGSTWDQVYVPSGGTANQVLKKTSNTDYDFEWSNVNTLLSFSLTGGSNIIPNNANLNDTTYLIAGNYVCPTTAVARTVTNIPADLDEAFMLRVYAPLARGDDDGSSVTGTWVYKIQEIHSMYANKIWRRFCHIDGTADTWNLEKWHMICVQDGIYVVNAAPSSASPDGLYFVVSS